LAWSTTAASEDPPWSAKNCHPVEIICAEGWVALSRGPEHSARGAEERGGDFGRPLPQRSLAAPERPLSEPRRPPPADPDGGGANGLSAPGRVGTIGAEWRGWWKVVQRFRRPRRARPPSSAPTAAAVREAGADGGLSRREQAEGAPARLESYRTGERLRGGLAWKPDGSCMAGGKGNAPLMANGDLRAWLLVPWGATPVPLGRVAGAVCGMRACGSHAP
jgi:hypothetical protein